MTTLTNPPLGPLLDRLFEEADAASPATSPAVANLSPEERERFMRSKTDYLEFYGRLKDIPLPSRERLTRCSTWALDDGKNAHQARQFSPLNDHLEKTTESRYASLPGKRSHRASP